MRYLSAAQYQELIDGASLLRADKHGPKVYQGRDGRIIKLFRVKHWWSSSMFYPYSIRFRRNSRRLQARGFRCVSVDEIFYCRAVRRHGVIYRRLDGEPLDSLLLADDEKAARVYREYAAFIAQLHARRVYFRSLHPGNILLMPDGGYGLIDIGDMRFPHTAVRLDQRRRNFRHLLRSAEFRDALRHHRAEDFIDAYLDATGLAAGPRRKLRAALSGDFARVVDSL